MEKKKKKKNETYFGFCEILLSILIFHSHARTHKNWFIRFDASWNVHSHEISANNNVIVSMRSYSVEMGAWSNWPKFLYLLPYFRYLFLDFYRFFPHMPHLARCLSHALQILFCSRIAVCQKMFFFPFDLIWKGDGNRDDDNCKTINGHSTGYVLSAPNNANNNANNKKETKTKRIKPSKR